MKEQNCSLCLYWRFRYPTDTTGECRCRPPTALVGWPSTNADDWCGEYALRMDLYNLPSDELPDQPRPRQGYEIR